MDSRQRRKWFLPLKGSMGKKQWVRVGKDAMEFASLFLLSQNRPTKIAEIPVRLAMADGLLTGVARTRGSLFGRAGTKKPLFCGDSPWLGVGTLYDAALLWGFFLMKK